MTVGCLPILNRLLERMKLEQFFRQHLKPDGSRTRLCTPRALLVLVRNLLLSREPIYGIGEWAARYAPDLLGLDANELAAFNDDRLGRALDRLFESGESQLVMELVRWVIQEFDLSLDELHNDSTSVSVFGAYSDADEEGTQQGQKTVAITYGHSKDHRPDLKQLLYTLTITEDGGCQSDLPHIVEILSMIRRTARLGTSCGSSSVERTFCMSRTVSSRVRTI